MQVWFSLGNLRQGFRLDNFCSALLFYDPMSLFLYNYDWLIALQTAGCQHVFSILLLYLHIAIYTLTWEVMIHILHYKAVNYGLLDSGHKTFMVQDKPR